jgi:hypothetical protein
MALAHCILGNMADGLEYSGSSSHILSKSKGNSDIQSCVKCLEWEMRLKEIIDELSSAQVITDLLRSEMCVETEKHGDNTLMVLNMWKKQ